MGLHSTLLVEGGEGGREGGKGGREGREGGRDQGRGGKMKEWRRVCETHLHTLLPPPEP